MGVQINGDTGNISATKADYSGNVTIGGTLTYEDVTNVDSIGIVTARNGIEIGASPGVAASISVDGNMIVSGITTIGGDIKVGSGVTIGKDGHLFATGVTTSTTVKVGAAVTISESGIEASGIGITCANINGTQIGGRRNKVINGGMTISQRNGTSSVQLSATEVYTVDRFKNDTGSSFNMTADASQVTDHPIGFSNALKIQCDATNTPTGGHNGGLSTFIEGLDVQDFGFGSSGAKPITVSFYAKSASGNSGQTFGFMLGYSRSSDSARVKQTRSFTVTDTWQRFVFTFQPNGQAQSSGIVNTTAYGLQLFWSLAAGPDDILDEITTWTAAQALVGVTGQSNLFDTVSNQFFLTGVQCEVGSQATPFEHRSFGEEERLCLRYCYVISDGALGMGAQKASDQIIGHIQFPVPMRTAPSATTDSLVLRIDSGLHLESSSSGTFSLSEAGTRGTGYKMTGFSGGLANGSGFFVKENSGSITLDAEL